MSDSIINTSPASHPFPAGLAVKVTGGAYDGEHGVVVDQRPDLRPGSVWVRLQKSGIRLIPGYRLTTHESS